MAFAIRFQSCMLFVQTRLVSEILLVAKAWMEDNILH